MAAMLLAGALLPQCAEAAAFYGLTQKDGVAQAVIVDVDSGAVTVIFPTTIPAFEVVWGNSTFDPASKRWFVHTITDLAGLYVVDLIARTTTRVQLSIAPPENYVDLGYDAATGRLYGLMRHGTGARVVWIDLSTGNVVPLIDAPPAVTAAIPGQAFDAAGGRLFYEWRSILYIFDVNRRTVAQVPLALASADVLSLTWDPTTSTLFGVTAIGPSLVVRVDPATGSMTRLGILPVMPFPEVPRAFDPNTATFWVLLPDPTLALHAAAVDISADAVAPLGARLTFGQRYVLASEPVSAGAIEVPAMSSWGLLAVLACICAVAFSRLR